MPALEPVPSAQEQLDQLAASRGRLAAQQVLPWWWYVGWVAGYVCMMVGLSFMWSGWTFKAVYAVGLITMLVFGRQRRKLQGARPTRMTDRERQRAFLVALTGLVAGGVVGYALVQIGSAWLFVALFVATAPLVAFDLRRSHRRQGERIESAL